MATAAYRQTRIQASIPQPRHPRMQLLGLTALAMTGGLVLVAVPALTLTASGAAIWMFFSAATPLEWLIMELLAATAATGLLASADLLLVRPPAPQGIRLKQKQAPELFAMIRRRTDTFGLAPVDRVLLIEEPRLELVLTPGRGFPGATEQTLLIGWPLLSFLSVKQFRVALRAVLGQWSGRRNRCTGFIYRQHAFWTGLRQHYMHRTFPAAWLLRKPICLFSSYFERQAAELIRMQRLDQDFYALEVTDEEQVLALIAAEVLGAAFMEKKFWPMIFAAAERTPDPVVKPFTNFNAVMDRTLYKEDADRWLLQALAAEDKHGHISLRERLAVLGYSELHWPGLPQQAALDILFGRHWQAIAAQLDHNWQQSVQQAWTDRHWRFRQDQDQFYALQQKAAREAITGATAIRYLRLAEQFLKQDELLALCKRLLRVNRTHADVCFQCGKQLLAAADDDGIRAIEIAMQLDKTYTTQGNRLIHAFERTNRVIPFRQAASA